MTTEHPTGSNPSLVVQSFLRALNDDNFDEAKKYLAHDIKFEGVMGSRDGADNYIGDMQKMKFKYDIKKIFAEGDHVGIFYDINMGGPVIFCAGWYSVKEAKISNIRVVFDPRPLLQKA